MKIQELITAAEEFYGNDKKANERYSPLWLLKTHAEIALENLNKIPEVAQYQLTEVEFSTIIMLQGFASHLIQEAAFNPNMSNALSSILIDALDSALIKIPKNTEETLYRNDDVNNREYSVGQEIQFNGFFTTSKDDFDNASHIKWIITPLDSTRTKAHEIYRVYNHGLEFTAPENQIEFERGATFVVTAVENGETFRTIHITETQS